MAFFAANWIYFLIALIIFTISLFINFILMFKRISKGNINMGNNVIFHITFGLGIGISAILLLMSIIALFLQK